MHPYLSGPYRPVHDERTDVDLPIEGELPADLSGMFVQNSPNPRFSPRGRHHWFDGDGMVHGVALSEGRATYRNRYVRTRDFERETEANGPLWAGILDPFDPDSPLGPDKDTANTDLVFHNGRLLALWWLGGTPVELSIPELETLGEPPYGLDCGMLAHPKVCPETGELIFLDCDLYARPYLRYGVVSADGTLAHRIDIDTPHASFFHDIAITPNFTIIPDLPLRWDPSRLDQGKRRVAFDADRPARFGVIPRHGEADAIQWFEVPACYIFHTVNAWEEGDRIVLVACRVDNPIPTRPPGEEPDVPRLAFIRLEPYLVRWTFDRTTGAVTEEQLDDLACEFPRVDPRRLGKPSQTCFAQRLAREPTLFFDGVSKVDLRTNTRTERSWGDGRVGSETIVVPRPGSTDDDDAWLIAMIVDRTDDTAALEVLDAQTLERACRISVPRRVPVGFHTHWAPFATA